MYGAGTNANVYLTMFGKTKDDNTAKFDKINLDNKGDNFESGNVDEFEVDSLDFEKVEKVRIGRDKSGMIAGWHLDKVSNYTMNYAIFMYNGIYTCYICIIKYECI